MPLESCMILLDNSEFMRNGDYIPTRLEAQHDAANLLVGAKTQSHPESTVGVSAGTELLVSPTEDVGKILNALHGLPIASKTKDVTAAVQVASLALKHRRNKNGSQRIVLFVGTPLEGIEVKALQKAGRQLKKNNVAIDVIVLGELESNEDKLRELVDAANGRSDDGAERTCHLVSIPAGVLPSDVLASSPIVHGGSGGSAFAASAAAAAVAGGAGGDVFSEFGGVDPNMDPELAMALRVSMEEERARQQRIAAQQAAEQQSSAAEDSKDTEMGDAALSAMDMGFSEEEALLQQALAMSMNENEPKHPAEEEDSKPAAEAAMEEDDEAAAMQLALQMSMQTEQEGNKGSDMHVNDPQFVNQLLGSLPGVDANDPAIKDALQNLRDKKDGDDDKQDPSKK
jgi:26S proteasome regulatory subunit N10